MLNPEPLIVAGVDPGNVEGWAYAPVEHNIKDRREEKPNGENNIEGGRHVL